MVSPEVEKSRGLSSYFSRTCSRVNWLLLLLDLSSNDLNVSDVLQVHRGVMVSHTMYALNMERILSRLWHPSHEELEQDQIHRQRLAAKEGLLIS